MKRDKIKRIPYGKGDFEAVNGQGRYFVDKTMYIPLIEDIDFNFLIRPRRFGKTLFLSMLETYYDLNKGDRFEEFFYDTWILKNPTELRNSYMILYFNFSCVRSDINEVEDSFNKHCCASIRNFTDKYRQYLPADKVKEVEAETKAHEMLNLLATSFNDLDHKIYLMIDEYDNFTNTIVAQSGEHAYNKITREDGFFKDFFKVLKGAASGSGSALERMFITGVSPITMDDVTSGFNIGNNITVNPRFQKAVGFTQDEVKKIIDYYSGVDLMRLDKGETIRLMKEWYDGYQFAASVSETMFNSDMVLYFMKEVYDLDVMPDDMIDENVRIDYGKLRHFLTINNRLNGNFDILETILTEGGISGNLVKSFPYREVTKRDNFISLLFYFGLITMDGAKKGEPWFSMPNNVIKNLMLNFIRKGYEDVYDLNLDVYGLLRLMQAMAYDGEFKGSMEFIAETISSQSSNRDFMSGEKVVQAFFMSLLNVCNFYIIESEKEANHGYADIALIPFAARYTDMKFAYLIELKYLKAGDSDSVRKTKIEEARKQLAKYSDDDKLKKLMHTAPHGTITLKRLILVFKGAEMVHLEEVQAEST